MPQTPQAAQREAWHDRHEMRSAGPRPGAPARAFNPYAPPSDDSDGGPPAALDGEPTLAQPSQRLFAKLIDRGLLAVVLAPGVVTQVLWDTNLGVGLWFLMMVGFGLVQWTLIAVTGQSVGKRWLGIRVITDKRGRVGLLRGVVLRSWVMWLGSLPTGGFPLLLDPWFVFGKQRKAMHDTLAGTMVIVANTPGDPYAQR